MVGNATVSRKEEASTAIIPTIRRTSLHGVRVIKSATESIKQNMKIS
jgi:hypothetical protein